MSEIRLYNGDCLKEMDRIADNSIDCIICDLPYGTSACSWDTIIPFDKLWKQYERIIKDNGAIVLFGQEPFSSLLRASNLKLYKYDWVWEKPSGANFLNLKYQPSKIHENIMIFGKGATSYSKNINMNYNPQMEEGEPYKCTSGKQKNDYNNSSVRSPIKQTTTENNGTRYPKSILKFNRDKDKLHPTQKPVALLEYLIKTYSNENDTILDNTMGSGSTGVACINTNRNFIGVEMNEEYFNIASNRINEALKSKYLIKKEEIKNEEQGLF